MAMEGLWTQVDALVWEKTQLETELRKLREAKPEEAAMLQRMYPRMSNARMSNPIMSNAEMSNPTMSNT